MKKLRQLKKPSSLGKPNGTPGASNSLKSNPAGTGRFGSIACTIESGITIARVHDDIS